MTWIIIQFHYLNDLSSKQPYCCALCKQGYCIIIALMFKKILRENKLRNLKKDIRNMNFFSSCLLLPILVVFLFFFKLQTNIQWKFCGIYRLDIRRLSLEDSSFNWIIYNIYIQQIAFVSHIILNNLSRCSFSLFSLFLSLLSLDALS